MDVEHSREYWLMKMGKQDPDRWCSYTECGQELWQIACQWVWNLRLSLGHVMQGSEVRDIEWAPPKERPPLIVASESTSEEYGPWQPSGDAGRARGRFGADAFTLQEDGTLHCPAGATLWFSERRQENGFTEAQQSTWPPWMTVENVHYVSSVSGEGLKATGLVG